MEPFKIPHWRMVVSPVGGAGGAALAHRKARQFTRSRRGPREPSTDSAALAWVSKEREVSSDVSTPLFYNNRFFILNSDRRTLSCVEPANRPVIWTGSLNTPSSWKPRPPRGRQDLHINHAGDVFVAVAGNVFKLRHMTSMGMRRKRDGPVYHCGFRRRPLCSHREQAVLLGDAR